MAIYGGVMTTHRHPDQFRWSTVVRLALCVSLLVAVPLARNGWAQVTFPAAPGTGSFVTDEAKLLTVAHRQGIDALAGALKREHGYPVSVVTIRSLAAHGAAGYTIERYASEMLKAWKPDADRQGYGLTLLVSPTIAWPVSSSRPRGRARTTAGPERSWTA